MNNTLERTVTLDRDLVRRADRKVRRYGRTFDDVMGYVLNIVVSQKGDPVGCAVYDMAQARNRRTRHQAFVRDCKEAVAEIKAGLATPTSPEELIAEAFG